MTAVASLSNFIPDPPPEALATADQLHAAFSKLVAALPGQPQRPMDLARAVNADKSVAHRLVTAISKGAHLGMLITIPGPAPLLEIIQAARRLGVPATLCAETTEAVGRFDSLVQELAGDRATFDAMMSEWVEDARSHVDTAARQMIFRGMKHVHGVAAETSYTAFLIHPSQTSPDRADLMTLDGLIGLHRVRSGGNLVVAKTSDLAVSVSVVDSTRRLLQEYCSKPVPAFKTSGPITALTCVMDWEGRLGHRQTCDVVVGEVDRGLLGYHRSKPEREFGGLGCCPWVPVREAIVDLLLHRDVFTTCIPNFIMSRTGIHGMIDPNDPSRLHDRIRFDCQMQAFSVGGASQMSTPEVPFHRRMLEGQTSSVGWKLSEFRAFRVRVDYPIFDTQLMYIVPVPEHNP